MYGLALLVYFLSAQRVEAYTVTNLDDIENGIGVSVVTEKTAQIYKGADLFATLLGDVYYKEGLYTYLLTVSPSSRDSHISVFQSDTYLTLPALTGLAGYSFSDAALAGLKSSFNTEPGDSAFSVDMITLPGVNQIKWATTGSNLWTEQQSITFFYQSVYAPGMGDYELINSAPAGYASNYVPAVPEPATMLLLAPGLIGFIGLRRRFQKS
jgi:hypothetical protein